MCFDSFVVRWNMSAEMRWIFLFIYFLETKFSGNISVRVSCQSPINLLIVKLFLFCQIVWFKVQDKSETKSFKRSNRINKSFLFTTLNVNYCESFMTLVTIFSLRNYNMNNLLRAVGHFLIDVIGVIEKEVENFFCFIMLFLNQCQCCWILGGTFDCDWGKPTFSPTLLSLLLLNRWFIMSHFCRNLFDPETNFKHYVKHFPRKMCQDKEFTPFQYDNKTQPSKLTAKVWTFPSYWQDVKSQFQEIVFVRIFSFLFDWKFSKIIAT